jgi:3',5'-cyclic AMP phosphodiesterase CpdA
MPPIDSFLHATDFHFWSVPRNPFLLANKRFLGVVNVLLRRRREFRQHLATENLEAMAALGIDTVFLTGDFTSTALPTEFERAAAWVRKTESRGMRPVVFPGNHDVYTFESERKERFRRYLGQWMPAEFLPARDALPGGTPVVYVPTVCPNWISSKGRITHLEAEAAQLLIKSSAEPLVVTGHYPVLNETATYTIAPERRLRNAAELRDVLGRSGKRILYVAGHVHRFSLTCDPEYPNVTHLTTGTFFGRDHIPGKEGEFSEVHIEPDHFVVRRHLCRDGEWTVDVHEAA